MTRLIVQPIDPAAPGSWRQRSQMFAAIRLVTDVQESGSVSDTLVAYSALEALLIPRLRTDDGTPVEAVLDQLSANEFDAMLESVASIEPTVPPETASS